MVTQAIRVGLEPVLFYRKDPARVVIIDFVIQNFSANHIYFGDSVGVSIGGGLVIEPNGVFDKDGWQNDIYLVSDVADSDVRVTFQEYIIAQRKDP